MRLFMAVFIVAMLSLASAAGQVVVELRPASIDPGEGLTPMTASDGATMHVGADVIVANADIESASASADPVSAMPIVTIHLTSDSARRFGEYTSAQNMGYVAIVVDGMLVSAPMIREPILGGQIQISGNLTVEDAERIAAGLNGGKD